MVSSLIWLFHTCAVAMFQYSCTVKNLQRIETFSYTTCVKKTISAQRPNGKDKFSASDWKMLFLLKLESIQEKFHSDIWCYLLPCVQWTEFDFCFLVIVTTAAVTENWCHNGDICSFIFFGTFILARLGFLNCRQLLNNKTIGGKLLLTAR